MRYIQYFLVGLFAAIVLCPPMYSQSADGAASLHEGVHFEVAYGVVWAESTEKPLPQPLLLLISSRYATRVTVFSASELGPINKAYKLEPNKVLRVAIKTPYLSLTSGGKRVNGVTVTSEAPVTVATYIAYYSNGGMTLHYPVETWGKSYHVFSNPQDEFGASTNIQRRPGQIVVLAAEDSTFITIQSPARIAGSLEHGIIAPNTPQTIQLQAHETLTLLAAIDSAKSHTTSTDLTGTRITATKPVSVLSGHTKGAVGIKYPVLPPSGAFASPAHFVRNNYYQSLLHDGLADTTFVTVPMLYTATRVTVGDQVVPSDVVRILALQNGTVVRRSRLDGSGYVNVAMLDSGRYFTDTLVTEAYRWTTSKPAFVMQYGKSYAKILPLGGEAQTPIDKDITQPQGYPTLVSGMPTMMVIPGESQWIERGTFYAPEGMDNFVSVIMKSQDVGSVLVNGQNINGTQLHPINGTDLTYARLEVPTGDLQVTTEPAAKIMVWSHGSLDGLQQGRAYGHPIGVNVTRACIDSIGVYVDRFAQYARAIASMTSGSDCSSLLRYEVLSSKNAFIDSVSFRPDSLHADSISVFASLTNPDSAGTMTVRFTSTSGKSVDAQLLLPVIPPPHYRNNLRFEIKAAKRGGVLEAKLIVDSMIDERFSSFFVTMRYDTRTFAPRSAFVSDSTSSNTRTSTFERLVFPRTVGTVLGKFDYLVLFSQQPIMYPIITDVVWYDSITPVPFVETFIKTVVIDTVVDSVEVGVDEVPIAGSQLQLAVQPQPASDIVTITYGKGQERGSTSGSIRDYSLRVFDFTGAVIMDLSEKLAGEEGTIRLNTHVFARGMYVLQLSNGIDVLVERMVVE